MHNPFSLKSAEIIEINKENADTKTYTVKYIDKNARARFDHDFDPGKFVMISILGFGEAPFSLSSTLKDKAFKITIRNVGDLTKRMNCMKKGDYVGLRGPYGRGWPMKESEGKDVLIVSGGIGLAPLKPVINYIGEARKRYGHIEVLYGAKTPDNMIFVDEFDGWKCVKDLKLRLTVDSVPDKIAWDHDVGVVPLLLDKVDIQPGNSVVMTCGPEIMMHFVVQSLLARGFDDEQIYISLERRMKCGIAQCGHCMIGMKYVCRDGPVFPYSEVKGLPDLTV